MRRFPTLQAEISAAASHSLEKFREDGKKTVARLVDMESSYLTVEFFRRLPQEMDRAGNPIGEKGGQPGERALSAGDKRGKTRERGGNPSEVDGYSANSAMNLDRYSDAHFRRIASNVSSYVSMVSETLRNTIPKAAVYCQVREAKMSLLNHFYAQLGRKEVLSLSLCD